jgi:hypothetical protein
MNATTIKNITGLASTRLLLVVLAVVLSAVAIFGPAQAAFAAGCRYYSTYTPGAHVAPSSGDPGTWYYATTAFAPSGSSCGSINIVRSSIETLQGGSNACGNFRVRFFPTSGGSWVTNYQLVCTGTSYAKLATSVINGTKYRVEADARLRFTVFD